MLMLLILSFVNMYIIWFEGWFRAIEPKCVLSAIYIHKVIYDLCGGSAHIIKKGLCWFITFMYKTTIVK